MFVFFMSSTNINNIVGDIVIVTMYHDTQFILVIYHTCDLLTLDNSCKECISNVMLKICLFLFLEAILIMP